MTAINCDIDKEIQEAGGFNQALQKQENKRRNKNLSKEEKNQIDNNINKLQEEMKPEKIVKRRSRKINSVGNPEMPIANTGGNLNSDNIKNEGIPIQDKAIVIQSEAEENKQAPSSNIIENNIANVEDKIKAVGSKEEVYYGTAKRTAGKLKKEDLILNKNGKIVSKKKSENAKKLGTASRLQPFSKSANQSDQKEQN